jgi:hypothetical protein
MTYLQIVLHTHTQVEQHTSPFELQQIPTLFANFGKKFKHEVSKYKQNQHLRPLALCSCPLQQTWT